MQFRDKTVQVNEGEFIVIPKGVEHNPMTKNDKIMHVLLLKKKKQPIQGMLNMNEHNHHILKFSDEESYILIATTIY